MTIALHRNSVRWGNTNSLLTFNGNFVGGVGPGTLYPIGLTAGQLVMMLINTKSYAVASSLVTGNTIDRTASVPAAAGFFITGPTAFTDLIFSGSNNAQIDIFGGPAYLNPSDGLFYPEFRLIAGDGTNEVSTSETGGPSGSTLSLFGSPPFAIPTRPGDSLAPTAFTINQNTVF